MQCDMLVKLYQLPDDVFSEPVRKLRENGITLKRAMTADLSRVRSFVETNFSTGWADECTAGILKNGCWIAVKDGEILGFACFDATMPDYFGPIGVREDIRTGGIGKALLLRSLCSMKEKGYAYAIIGWTGPQEFYRKCCGAVPIPDSIPGSYHNLTSVSTEPEGQI